MRIHCQCLVDEKKLIVNRTGLIQYIADSTQLEHVGGLEYLKTWLIERRKLFMERDSLSAEIVPKGVLVMGVSGLRQKPVGEGNRLLLRASALPHRNERSVFRAPWKSGCRVRRGMPHRRVGCAGRRLV